MEIKKVSQQNWEMLKDLVSQDLFRKKADIFAAVENEKAVGVLVMEKNDIDFVISIFMDSSESSDAAYCRFFVG